MNDHALFINTCAHKPSAQTLKHADGVKLKEAGVWIDAQSSYVTTSERKC